MVTKRLQYRYDAVGNKVGMTDADRGLFTYTYDVMRRLTGVINPLGERTTYTYDLNGRRTSAQLANGTRTSYSYDQGSRVQQIHTLKSNNSTVAKFDYAYDNNGRRTSVLEADGSRVTWTYDGTSQVTSEWRTGTSPFRHTFVYDTRGNRTLKIEDGARTTLVYDAANQLSSSEDVGGTTNYTYDANGNQHVTVAPGGLRTTQIWDYENRLVKTLQPGGGVFTMAYDADGLRARKETPSETKLFVWDDQNYLAETDDSGVTEVAYTTEPSTYGSTISHRSGGATTTYHFDALAAARALTNASESALASYNYTAFGTILGTPSLLTPFLWGGLVGYYWDSDLATQYIRARHYQPHIARWISLDPIGFAGGDANFFRYVGNSPTTGSSNTFLRALNAASKLRLSTTHQYIPEGIRNGLVDPSGLSVTCASTGIRIVIVAGIWFQELYCWDSCGNSMIATLVTLAFGYHGGPIVGIPGVNAPKFEESCISSLKEGPTKDIPPKPAGLLPKIKKGRPTWGNGISVGIEQQLEIHYRNIVNDCPCGKLPPPPLPAPVENDGTATGRCEACKDACTISCGITNEDSDDFNKCHTRCVLDDFSVFDELGGCEGWKDYINP